jgi:hypothetical protein
MKLSDKIESSESIQHQFEMSSSSATRRSASTASYTFGVPGSQVTLNIGKSGERSLVLSRGPNSKTSSSVPAAPVPAGQRKFPDGYIGPADMPFCKVCYDAGLPVADYTDHFVKNQPGPDGKVVCPTLLAQKCLNCGVAGHTSSYCTQTIQREKERTVRSRDEYEQTKKASGGWETVGQKGAVVKSKPRIEDMVSKSTKPAATKPVAVTVSKSYGAFSALAVEDTSDASDVEREEEEIRHTPAGVPKPVPKSRDILTGPPPAVEPAKPMSWAQRAAAAAQKPAAVVVSSAAAPLTDTRFQLHALCDRIEQSNRAPKKVNTVAETANHRGAAAAIASESSKKRKQTAALVPA